MASMVLELDISPVTNWHCFPENILSCDGSLTALQKIFVCITSPHILPLLKLNARSPAQPVTPPVLRLLHRCTHFSCSSLPLCISAEREIPSRPLVRGVQICSLPISHHVSLTGSDLARTRAALGVMNHRFIFLSHMWVKLFDINHTPAAPVWNRRAICLPPVAGGSLCLYPECPF